MDMVQISVAKLRLKILIYTAAFIIINSLWTTNNGVIAEKMVLLSDNNCDRYSLEALYQEQYKYQLEEIMAEATTFAPRILDKIFDDIQEIATKIPGSEKTSMRQKKTYDTYAFIKKKFLEKMDASMANITEHWEHLLASNFAFLASKKEGSAEQVMERVRKLYEAYLTAEATYHQYMRKVIIPVKTLATQSLKGVQQIAKMKANKAAAAQDKESQNVTSFKETMKETVQEVSSKFIGQITIMVIEREIDVTNNEPTKEDEAFKEALSAIQKLKDNVVATLLDAVHDFVKPSKEKLNLLRRNLYIYLAGVANDMYQERKTPTGRTPKMLEGAQQRFALLWDNDDKMAEKALYLAQCY